ncbi:diguanylate cyclase (GGDEF)-like protein [Ancylobacter sp. 3268]|uniref:sensor domain-containing diguanylate cyclase n=1 Tax=Ancylobacter sp. 3268 TaxID=2817752 RepID=UPI002862D770|nr:sensor domain-containing diguanylate cyclase [Ancylobacter sp. 3268]MDR6954337.1 diguanylate cyclase (GGDEF)-like protein [Ancylobacter sp. 3268]
MDEGALLLAELRRRLGPGAEAGSERLLLRLERLLAERARHLHDCDSALARYRKMYERSSSLAKIGVWECDLAIQELSWTDGVYDIFGLPRGCRVTREMVLALYADDSRREMERLREKAIREAGSFTLDIRVRNLDGASRWVRLSADVECENGRPVRIFGTKQDITLEKELWDRMRALAECDPLTGVANRKVFEERLAASLAAAPGPEALTALVLVDIDGFKHVNDTLGHAAGDECLRQTARRLGAAFGAASLTARIGGDEFAVLSFGAGDVACIESRAAEAIVHVSQPIAWMGEALTVTASIGIAGAMAADIGAAQLFAQADHALYAAKAAGRNTFRRFAAPALRPRMGVRTGSATLT